MSEANRKKSRVSDSEKAGLIFPVARVHRQLRLISTRTTRISKGGSVYIAAVLEYLCAELLELAGYEAKEGRKKRINPRHILFAVKRDKEFKPLWKDRIISGAGKVPWIPSLLEKPSKTRTIKKKK